MNFRIDLLVTFLLSVMFCNCFSQNYSVEYLEHFNDLDTKVFYEMEKSKSGHLYIGTDKGLMKYNGETFTRLQSPNGKTEEIFQFAFLNDSTFVYSNMQRELCFAVNDHIECEDIDLGYIVSGISRLNDSLLYLISPKRQTRQEILFNYQAKKEIKNESALIYKNFGNFGNAAISYSSVLHAKDSNDVQKNIGAVLNDSIIVRHPILRGENTNSNRVWSLHSKGLTDIEIINEKSMKIVTDKSITNGTNTFRCSYAINDSIVFFGTNNGIVVYNTFQKKITETLLKNKIVNSIYAVDGNTIYAGTNGQGAYKIYISKTLKKYTIYGDATYYNLLSNNDLIVFTEDKMYHISDTMKEKNINEIDLIEPNPKFNDRKGNLVLSKFSILKLNTPERLTPILNKNLESYALSFGSLKDYSIIDDSSFLLASSRGVFLINEHNDIIKDYLRLGDYRAFRIYEMANGGRYILCLDGLYYFDPIKKNLTLINQQINSNTVNEITMDFDDNFLYTTKEGTLNYFDGLNPRSINIADGILPDLLQIKTHTFYKENFFLLTNEIAYVLNGKDLSTVEVKNVHGTVDLPKVEKVFFHDGLFTIIQDHEVIRIHEDEFFVKKNVPVIESVSIKVNDELRAFKEKYRFSHNKNNIQIHLEAPTIDAHKTNNIYYKVEGLNNRWEVYKGNDLTINLDNLRPGSYQIKATPIKESYVKINEIPTLLSFTIVKPFWTTNLFIILLGLALMLTTAYITQSLLARKRLRYEMEVELEKNKNKAFKAQIKPHFIFNSLSSLLGLIATDKKEKALSHVEELSAFLRSTLQSSDKEWISLEEEIETIRNYIALENVRFSEDIELIVEVSSGIRLKLIHIPPLLIQPIVENSIVHGLLPQRGKKQGSILINIQFAGSDRLMIHVLDNGVGLLPTTAKEQLKEGFGLTLTKSRINSLIDKGIEPLIIKPREDQKGTIVSLTIPYKV